MGKKIIYIVLIIVFIISLIFINFILQRESQKVLSKGSEETTQKENNIQILKITEENFESEVLQSDKTVLIDFYADWCGPCRMMSPVIDDIAKELEGKVKVGKVNVDNNQELAIKYEVMSIPTIMVFEKGNPVKTFIGVTDKQEILDALK